jgi:glucose-6-phosphate isomerase
MCWLIEDQCTEYMVCAVCHRLVGVKRFDEWGVPLAKLHMREVVSGIAYQGRLKTKVKCEGSGVKGAT